MLTIPTQDGRALYAVLDAIEADGLMTEEAHVDRWRELQARVLRTGYTEERVHLLELLRALERGGHVEASWINAHWRSILAQALSAPVVTAPTFDLNAPISQAA